MNHDRKAQARKNVELARQALQEGDRSLAHRLARQAADLAPDWEDPWLVLAASSDLADSWAFLERAHRINPHSQRVRKGFEWLDRQGFQDQTMQSRPQPAAITTHTQTHAQSAGPETQPVATGRPVTRKRPLRMPWLVGALFLIVMGAAALSASHSPAFAAIMGNNKTAGSINYARADITKPTYTPSPTNTAVPTPTFTPVPTSTPEPTSTPVPEDTGDSPDPDVYGPPEPGYTGSKYILVDISEQHLYAYEGDVLVFSFVASTGMNNATSTGYFSVLNKIPNAYGATWDIWMPNWLGIYWSGTLQNGIHALPIMSNGVRLWSGYLGTPISYGCVVLGVDEAQLLYDWADIGTPVEIRW
ncbi:MAG: L,D-transpeptidase family protein [Anaerolineales bacterium]|nr:L,D-transpeptidase family protein [Anaerolineales bacterium]